MKVVKLQIETNTLLYGVFRGLLEPASGQKRYEATRYQVTLWQLQLKIPLSATRDQL